MIEVATELTVSDAYANNGKGDVWCLDRLGRTIVLPVRVWEEKILRDHAEMHGSVDSVVNTIESPDIHARDRVHSDREVFYR